MTKHMLPYYLSRTILSLIIGSLLYFTGSILWKAILLSGLILALFFWAPHSGRYSVHPEFGMAALRRDEFTQVVNDKAARNAFIVIMLMVGGMVIYYGFFGAIDASLSVIKIIICLGALSYFVSDILLRKSQQ